MAERASDRSTKQAEILQALAASLEEAPGSRITTAELARVLGVSEAALYRHFPSKARMFEGLLDFTEETVFGRIALVLREERLAAIRCQQITQIVLAFAARNPGLARLLVGDALVGEAERLRERVSRFFERLETQYRQVLREAVLHEAAPPRMDAADIAGVLIAFVAGRLALQVGSGFRRDPAEGLDRQWPRLTSGLFAP
ncbi:MAG TPA: nucleoid occlusion factor SlmA [Gammaproteobacteria bacterium]|nr:nucleoid occlusion factor SlmA [Gammaproteobacteria bacterium]